MEILFANQTSGGMHLLAGWAVRSCAAKDFTFKPPVEMVDSSSTSRHYWKYEGQVALKLLPKRSGLPSLSSHKEGLTKRCPRKVFWLAANPQVQR